jgi:flagellar basal body-associated protein FliL
MDENTPKKNDLRILWMIALIIVLFIAIKLIFAMLGAAIPKEKLNPPSSAPEQSVSETLPAPSFCPFCGEKLPESFQWGQFCTQCGGKIES